MKQTMDQILLLVKDKVLNAINTYCVELEIPKLTDSNIVIGSVNTTKDDRNTVLFINPDKRDFNSRSLIDYSVDTPIEFLFICKGETRDILYKYVCRYLACLEQVFIDDSVINDIGDIELINDDYFAEIEGKPDIKGTVLSTVLKQV